MYDQTRGLNRTSYAAYEYGDYATARSLDEQSLAIARELGYKWGIALSLYNLGLVAEAEGNNTEARSLSS